MGHIKPHTPSEELAPQLAWDEVFPPRPTLVPLVKTYVHNGKTTTKDEELCFAICERLLMGYSKRETARRWHVSRHTIEAIMVELEASGKMAPLKKRLSAKAGMVIEAGIDAIAEKIHDGTMPPQSLPIVVGVLADKKAAWDGEPTAIIGVQVELTVEAVTKLLADLPRAKDAVIDLPTDSQSTKTPSKTQ